MLLLLLLLRQQVVFVLVSSNVHVKSCIEVKILVPHKTCCYFG
jgi:hypothetical protein